MPQAELLNVRETARELGVHENTVRNWERRGVLRAVRLPHSGYRRFLAADVERLAAEMRHQFAPAIEGRASRPRGTGRIVHRDLD